jgi:hypothetical protein
MSRANTFENELDEIRVKLYEEIKDMTAEEHIAYIKDITAPILKEYGLRTVSRVKAGEQAEKETVLS